MKDNYCFGCFTEFPTATLLAIHNINIHGTWLMSGSYTCQFCGFTVRTAVRDFHESYCSTLHVGKGLPMRVKFK